MQRIDPLQLDDGIRDSVLALWQAGFATFTSCEGGIRHAFRHPTIGVTLVGNYDAFRSKLANFLRSRGCQSFEIIVVTSYHPAHEAPEVHVYVEGLDLLSPEKRKKAIALIRRRDAKLRQIVYELETVSDMKKL